MKLNFDVAAMGNPVLAGFGGIFCDKASNFKLAVAKIISYITNAMVEMWVVREKLSYDLAHGILDSLLKLIPLWFLF